MSVTCLQLAQDLASWAAKFTVFEQARQLSKGKMAAELLAELASLDPRVGRDDYYDAEGEIWDMEGLQGDLRIAKGEAPSAGHPEEGCPAGSGTRAAELFAELARLDPRVGRDDYYDAAWETWDMEGLQGDLKIAKGEAPSAGHPEEGGPAGAGTSAAELFAELARGDLKIAKAEAHSAGHPEEGGPAGSGERAAELFAELARLDPRVGREDYYDAEGETWDMEGLQGDLKIAKAEAPGAGHPEEGGPAGSGKRAAELFAELARLDPRVGREDYYDAEGETWDMEGLQGDLKIARECAQTTAVHPQQPQLDTKKRKYPVTSIDAAK
ncbi:hypothetical protein CYMTET_50225 [Cymbomonas tetramitiformis]|uniref:Uncharacterized protein n=1 Tax=Cymbomonas tetramitiformis TaxID=36881 RepID=A0AAE0BPV1_9CHLO|nr:hypothetical protein CYMTET_50225 [Cymbomonas tetramitiformis]